MFFNRIWNCLSEEVIKDLTLFYQKFNPRIAERLPNITTPSNDSAKHILDINAVSIINCSFADDSLSSQNKEKEAKRKKTRRKYGKKANEIKDIGKDQQSLESSLATLTIKPTVDPTGPKEDGWLKVCST